MLRKAINRLKRDYRIRRDWKRSKRAFVHFLERTGEIKMKNLESEDMIGILLTPWMGLPVPWYAMCIGMLLKEKGCKKIVYVVDDLWESAPTDYGNRGQISDIEKVLNRYLSKKFEFEIRYMSEQEIGECEEEDIECVKKYAELNSVKYIGNSIDDSFHKELKNGFEKWLLKELPLIIGLSNDKWRSFVIPGGMYQNTGVILETFGRRGIDVVTYDSGVNRYKIGIGCCAAQNGNVRTTAESILESGIEYKDAVKDAYEILDNRMNMKPELSLVSKGKIIQNAELDTKLDESYDIVIFTNLEFDTAALGTHTVFKNDYEWIEQTIDYVLEETSCNIAIRQHPLQRQFPNVLTNEVEIKRKYSNQARVRFINYDEKINSYKLLDDSKVIIVNTSTMGLEAGMLGKRVITESSAYYKKASFLWDCSSKEEYFSRINDLLLDPCEISLAEKEEAALYYYLTQRCSSIISFFTPQPSDYYAWCETGFEALAESEEVDYILNAITEHESVDYQSFSKLMNL